MRDKERSTSMAREAQLSLNPYPMPTRHGSYLSPKCGCNTRPIDVHNTNLPYLYEFILWCG